MRIYCDYAATAPLLPEVREAMQEAEELLTGNPSSIHRSGQEARVALERARKNLAAAIHAEPREIVFTSGGTEANNAVLFGLLKPGDHVLTSTIEHPSVLRPLERLESMGVEVTQVAPDDNGKIPVERIADGLRSHTRLISIMALNNETGVINDLEGIGALAAEKQMWFHTDAVQAFGKVDLDVKRLRLHYLSASAHKIGGPKGAGLLYVRHDAPLEPLILGGSQEQNRRGGTENLMGVLGFARASQVFTAHRQELAERLEDFRKQFLEGLSVAGIDFRVNGEDAYPGIVNLAFPGFKGHTLVMQLDLKGIAASYGSSCASGSAKISHVLQAMGRSEEDAMASVRFSFGWNTTAEEVDTVIRTLAEITALDSESDRKPAAASPVVKGISSE
jgi:cysteine desulfurase